MKGLPDFEPRSEFVTSTIWIITLHVLCQIPTAAAIQVIMLARCTVNLQDYNDP